MRILDFTDGFESAEEPTAQLVNAFANSALAQMPANTIKGNDTGSTGNVKDLTVDEVKQMLAVATVSFDSLAPTTTKGDLIVRSASGNARLPVGANGTVPVADSTQALGMRWDTLEFPPGIVLPFSGIALPNSFLFCDGAEIPRSTYSRLFSVIGTRYGIGDGSTTFRLPDFRGRFMRGADNMGTGAAVRDPDASTRTQQTLGTWTITAAITSGSAIATVSSTVNFATGMYLAGTGIPGGTQVQAILSSTTIQLSALATATNGAVTLTIDKSSAGNYPGSVQDDLYRAHRHGQYTDTGYGNCYPMVSSAGQGDFIGGTHPTQGSTATPGGTPYRWVSTTTEGGNETRPKNITVVYIIKF